MLKTTIIYWTSTGNTEAMAELIYEGASKEISNIEEIEVVKKYISDVTIEDIKSSDLITFGCSAMGVEEIDTSEMEPFIKSSRDAINHKPIALFGSYGWGDGEWMETWESMINELGGNLVIDSLMVNELPVGDDIDMCISFGQELVQIAKGL